MDGKLSLRTHRMIAGLSIKEAAERAEISEKSLRLWETDDEKLRRARFESIVKLCKIYGTSVDNLYY